MTKTRWIQSMTALWLAGTVGLQAEVKLEGRSVETPGHMIELDALGLPAQLQIRAAEADLPLRLRGGDAPTVAALQALGRGPQLSVPMRIEAVLAGEPAVATAMNAALPQVVDGAVVVQSDWQAGALHGTIALRYTNDGAISGRVRTRSGGAAVERLDLVIELAGPVDTALAGRPLVPDTGVVLPVDYGVLADGSGVLWRNGASPAGGGAAAPGAVEHFFLGNGDRGFTWLVHGEGTMPRGAAAAATVTVERSAEGVIRWRMALATGAIADGAEGGFTLLIHPSRASAPDRRALQWQPWTGEAAVPALSAAARAPLATDMVRADCGSVYEAFAKRAELAAAAGGAAGNAQLTLADRVPITLFRYLAATHTALAAQLVTDAAALVPAGGHPAVDRMALGRALLHDIGVDLSTLSGAVEAARVIAALDGLGMFADDGQTEFLPYWRTAGIVRFGEAFAAGAGFEVTEENPGARARVSVYLRPAAAAGRRQAVFVIVNESEHDLREQLYIQQPSYLFGGANRMTAAAIYSRLDFARVPADSDWRQPMMIGSAIRYDGGGTPRNTPQLMDLESGGFVRSVQTRDETEIYGLIHVPARGMRVLYGNSAP